jgi:hypothetical protein
MLQLSIGPRIHHQRQIGGRTIGTRNNAATPEKRRSVTVLVGELVEIII